jgi:uncharacterized protein
MAVNVERPPSVYAVQDDPMRPVPAARDGQRVMPATADPAPLGLAALAISLLVFSMFSAGLLAASGEPVVLGVALAYGGIAQLLAGMWEFRRGNTFGAAVFGSFGAFWLSYWLLQQFFVGQIPVAEQGAALGLFFVAWAILAAMLWAASLRTTVVVTATLFLLTISFVLLGIGQAGDHAEIIKVGGWFGLAAAAGALYGALAGLVNTTFERTVLPLVPLRRTT